MDSKANPFSVSRSIQELDATEIAMALSKFQVLGLMGHDRGDLIQTVMVPQDVTCLLECMLDFIRVKLDSSRSFQGTLSIL